MGDRLPNWFKDAAGRRPRSELRKKPNKILHLKPTPSTARPTPTIEAYFDGACGPKNPGGRATYGVLVKRGHTTLLIESGRVGEGPGMSNNVAEFAALNRVLEFLLTVDDYAVIRGDSQLVINKMRSMVPKANGLYAPFYARARALYRRIGDRLTFEWIPREENEVCDFLSKDQ